MKDSAGIAHFFSLVGRVADKGVAKEFMDWFDGYTTEVGAQKIETIWEIKAVRELPEKGQVEYRDHRYAQLAFELGKQLVAGNLIQKDSGPLGERYSIRIRVIK